MTERDPSVSLVERLNDLDTLASRHLAKVKANDNGVTYCKDCGEQWDSDDHSCVWKFVEAQAEALREAASRLAEGRRGRTPEVPCDNCTTLQHCEYHKRCLAECSPADLSTPPASPAATSGPADSVQPVCTSQETDQIEDLAAWLKGYGRRADACICLKFSRANEALRRVNAWVEKWAAPLEAGVTDADPWVYAARELQTVINDGVEVSAASRPAPQCKICESDGTKDSPASICDWHYNLALTDDDEFEASPRVSAATPANPTYHHEPTCATQRGGDCTCDPARLGWTHGPLEGDCEPAE